MKLYCDEKLCCRGEAAARLSAVAFGCCSAESPGWVGTAAWPGFGTHGQTGLYLLHQPAEPDDCHCSAVKEAAESTRGMWPRAGEGILHGGCPCRLAVPWHSWEEKDVLRHDPIEAGMALGSRDGLLLSRWGELSLPGTPMPRVQDALQMLPLLLTKGRD